MSVFNRTLPQPPLPTDKPDVQREADTLRAIDELKRVVQSLITSLDAFEPTQVTTADGKVVRALLQVLGNAPPDDAAIAVAPFQFLQQDADGNSTAGQNVFTLNPNSYFREDATKFDNTGIANSTNTFAFTAGDQVYLQLDASDDGSSLDEISLVCNQDGPGDAAIKVGGSGAEDDPFIWDQSFRRVAQVFDADASGQPTRGGVVYTVDSQTPPTQIEIVAQTTTHLYLRAFFFGGAICANAVDGDAPTLS